MSDAMLKRYESLVGLSGEKEGPDRRKRLDAELTRAHEIRRFEIGLYWQRSTYFWAFQAAILAAIGFAWTTRLTGWTLLPFTLAELGSITALAGVLAADGSKFWQENWERHIDMLERSGGGGLYTLIWLDANGSRWSVSRVNQRLNIVFLISWLMLVGVAFFKCQRWRAWTLDGRDAEIDWTLIAAISIGLLGLAAAVSLVLGGSRLTGRAIKPRGDALDEYELKTKSLPTIWPQRSRRDVLLRRYLPGDEESTVN